MTERSNEGFRPTTSLALYSDPLLSDPLLSDPLLSFHSDSLLSVTTKIVKDMLVFNSIRDRDSVRIDDEIR